MIANIARNPYCGVNHLDPTKKAKGLRQAGFGLRRCGTAVLGMPQPLTVLMMGMNSIPAPTSLQKKATFGSISWLLPGMTIREFCLLVLLQIAQRSLSGPLRLSGFTFPRTRRNKVQHHQHQARAGVESGGVNNG